MDIDGLYELFNFQFHWPDGGGVTQRSAKPCTGVRIPFWPQIQYAWVVKLAYAKDLKSFVFNQTCGFESHPGHQ